MIWAALGISHLKWKILFITCTMWRIVIIVIWPLFRKMPVNQKPLNWIGIFWYQFTPRKLLYLLVSLNMVKFDPHWLSVFIGPPCIVPFLSLPPQMKTTSSLVSRYLRSMCIYEYFCKLFVKCAFLVCHRFIRSLWPFAANAFIMVHVNMDNTELIVIVLQYLQSYSLWFEFAWHGYFSI